MTDITSKKLRGYPRADFFVPIAIGIAFLFLYISQQVTSIYGGDSGELVSAAYTWGIAHPPGYPLYTFLGALLSHVVTGGTVAWRVGFLSSVPMAVSVYFLWRIIHRLTQNLLAPTIASVWYGLLYPVWLYAITPEVFGMYAMFSAVFVYLTIVWIEDQNTRTLLLLAFVTGLALTHHHLILLAIAASSFTLYKYYKKPIATLRTHVGRFVFLFAVGFAPYVYAPVASFFNPPFDREHAATLVGFLRLITRASYGSFRASGFTTGGIFNGIADMATFIQYMYKDFTIIGIAFALAGLYSLWVTRKRVFTFIAAYLTLLLLYFSYAGFPVVNNFQLGTLERFFIVPYQIIAVCVGVGSAFLCEKIVTIISGTKSMSFLKRTLLFTVVYGIIVVIPLSAFRNNYASFALLTRDTTLERYAEDILAGIPNGAVYGVYQDTTSSAMDYAHYVQGKRPDMIFLNYYLLSKPYYRQQLKVRHPKLVLPEWTLHMTVTDYISAFLHANTGDFMFTSDIVLPGVPGYFVPSGLVYVYYSKLEDIPERSLILDKNERLWNGFNDPFSGALGQYKHLFLSDVLRLYADHSIALAQSYVLSGKFAESRKYISYAIAHETNIRIEEYVPYVDLLMEKNECSIARQTINDVYEKWSGDFVILEMYHNLVGSCYPGDAELQKFEAEYQKLKPSYDTQIR